MFRSLVELRPAIQINMALLKECGISGISKTINMSLLRSDTRRVRQNFQVRFNTDQRYREGKKAVMSKRSVSRRTFVKTALVGTAVASLDLGGFPSIVPSSVFGAHAPSNRVNIGAIGNGRISRGHDLPGVWRYDEAQVIAVCD